MPIKKETKQLSSFCCWSAKLQQLFVIHFMIICGVQCTLYSICNQQLQPTAHRYIYILSVEIELTHCAILFQHFKHRKRKNKFHSRMSIAHIVGRYICIHTNTHAFNRSSLYTQFYCCPFLCTRRKSLSAGPSYNSYQICWMVWGGVEKEGIYVGPKRNNTLMAKHSSEHTHSWRVWNGV